MGPWGERTFNTSPLLCIGEGDGNPLQCSCLENPRDGGAWWAAIYGVTQSRTRLKWLSRSSSSRVKECWCSHHHAQSLQLCPTLCDTMYCSPPGSSVHGILQAIILEWVAMPSSRRSSQPRNRTHVPCGGLGRSDGGRRTWDFSCYNF